MNIEIIMDVIPERLTLNVLKIYSFLEISLVSKINKYLWNNSFTWKNNSITCIIILKNINSQLLSKIEISLHNSKIVELGKKRMFKLSKEK